MINSDKGQQSRSVITRAALMHAAEKLIAQKGLEKVSIREIVTAAGQKNESVLQYHFQNLRGLFYEIQKTREKQTQEKRAELLADLLIKVDVPSLRDLCTLMTEPSFLLAKASPGYQCYILAFSHQLALVPESALSLVSKKGGGGESGLKTGSLLRAALPHLDEDAYQQRMESAVRLTAISMGHHARSKNAFRGAKAELFLSNLIDAIVGLLSEPESAETKALRFSVRAS